MRRGRHVFAALAMAAGLMALTGCVSQDDTVIPLWSVPIPPASAGDVQVKENPCADCRRAAKVLVKVEYGPLAGLRETPHRDKPVTADLLDPVGRQYVETWIQDCRQKIARVPGVTVVDHGPADYTAMMRVGVGNTNRFPKAYGVSFSRTCEISDGTGSVIVRDSISPIAFSVPFRGQATVPSRHVDQAQNLNLEPLRERLVPHAFVCEVRDRGGFVRVPVQDTRLARVRVNQLVGFHAHTHGNDGIRGTCLGRGLVVSKKDGSVWIQVYNPDEARIAVGTLVAP